MGLFDSIKGALGSVRGAPFRRRSARYWRKRSITIAGLIAAGTSRRSRPTGSSHGSAMARTCRSPKTSSRRSSAMRRGFRTSRGRPACPSTDSANSWRNTCRRSSTRRARTACCRIDAKLRVSFSSNGQFEEINMKTIAIVFASRSGRRAGADRGPTGCWPVRPADTAGAACNTQIGPKNLHGRSCAAISLRQHEAPHGTLGQHVTDVWPCAICRRTCRSWPPPG